MIFFLGMEGINENTPLGKRLIELAKESGVSDFYITPWEPLAYRKNGDLVFDSYIYQLDEYFLPTFLEIEKLIQTN